MINSNLVTLVREARVADKEKGVHARPLTALVAIYTQFKADEPEGEITLKNQVTNREVRLSQPKIEILCFDSNYNDLIRIEMTGKKNQKNISFLEELARVISEEEYFVEILKKYRIMYSGPYMRYFI